MVVGARFSERSLWLCEVIWSIRNEIEPNVGISHLRQRFSSCHVVLTGTWCVVLALFGTRTHPNWLGVAAESRFTLLVHAWLRVVSTDLGEVVWSFDATVKSDLWISDPCDVVAFLVLAWSRCHQDLVLRLLPNSKGLGTRAEF